MNPARIIIGAAIWVVIAFTAGYWFAGRWTVDKQSTLAEVVEFVSAPRSVVQLEFERETPVEVGDPIFVEQNDRLKQIGAIQRVLDPTSREDRLVWTNWAEANFFASAPRLREGDYLSYHQTPPSMDWVIRTMFPQKKREQIAELISQAYRDNHQVIFEQFRPIIEEALSEAAEVVQQDLRAAVDKRREEIQALGARFELEIVEQKLIPLLDEVIWPIVVRNVEPLLNEVGEEIWQRASVWRFGWRFIYDASPLPQRDLIKKEFGRFVQNDAIPVLESHVDDFVSVQRRVLADIAENPKVQEVVLDSLGTVVEDPEAQELTLEILREVFIESPRLRQVLTKHWNSPRAKGVLEMTDDRLEPTVLQIGELLFGSPNDTVTPEFARVLRHKVLLKDQRWFMLKHHADAPIQSAPPPNVLTVVPGQTSTENPFFIPARSRD